MTTAHRQDTPPDTMNGEAMEATAKGISLADRLRSNPEAKAIIAKMSDREILGLLHDWKFWARPEQIAPAWDWDTWLLCAGRGFGKTRTGAEWVIEEAKQAPNQRIALVARTAADTRDVMVLGESGILSIAPPWFRPEYNPSNRLLTFPNGSIAQTFSADKPDALRGPQFHKAWADELAAWRYPEAWDQLQFGLRLGHNPQAVVTTTPRPTPLVKDLIADSRTAKTTGSTYANRANLAASFLRKLERKYDGTRLGRQELHAEILEDVIGALWTHDLIEAGRMHPDGKGKVELPTLVRIVVAIDPAVTSNANSDETGIVVAGIDGRGHYYILADATVTMATPREWGRAGAKAYHDHRADRLVGEVNNGGDLVEMNMRSVDPDISYSAVRATRGKLLRAEPVASLYEQGRVHHVGCFPELEDQMTTYSPITDEKSPDRLDALVWAITELMSAEGAGPNIR